uniref:FYVE, RhoGEF and PH domain-containing protein 4 n=1 Tax=Panagrolaimus sp. ES5 TaxID=591445 RepID=A0AC34F1Q7_9BILA
MLQTFDKFKIPPDINLQGGEIKSIEETEEIDPEDNCKVQVITYTIVSADGTEESQITKRRKLKVNCTQHTKRTQFYNGKEATKEEKFEVLSADVNGFQRYHYDSNEPSTIRFDNNNMFSHSLIRPQDNFMSLLIEKKDQLKKAFPDLFENMRTQPAIFETPSTTTETVVNPDGTTTTRTQTSKAFSSRYTHHETYVNGVKQESKCKYRAQFEYKGPDGGFSMNLKNAADDDLSEDETDDDDLLFKRFILPDNNYPTPQMMIAYRNDRKPSSSLRAIEDDRHSHSDFSEITDTTSALINDTGKTPKIEPKALKRQEKAFHAVNEIAESEARYVAKLALLEKFRAEVEKEKVLEKKQMSGIFANTTSLYQFHNQHLLPQLLDRTRYWQTHHRISDVFKKQAPFMKMYSEYTNNYKNAIQIFEDNLKKKKKFNDIVRSYEKSPECENLPLISHLICPVQRVMRYQLLLKEYLKYLTAEDHDFEDTEKALELVLEAASHANEMMRRLDRYRNVLEVQELLGNSISLVSPGRELLKRSKLMKISSKYDKTEERHLFVFNDIILLASERSIALGGKFRVRAIFDVYYTNICEGDNLERENSFYLRGCDSQNGPTTRIELFTETSSEKKEIIDSIWSAIMEVQQRKKSFTTSFSNNSLNSPRTERKCCAKCEADFTWFISSIACTRCNQRYCKKCFGHRRQDHKRLRICEECVKQYNEKRRSKESRGLTERQNLLEVSAITDDYVVRGNLKFKGPSGKTVTRFFVLRKNFCLYSYLDEEADSALAMLPISGCEIEQLQEKYSFSIRHLNRIYTFTSQTDTEHAEWMAALILSANAQLPTEDSRKSA